MAQTKKEMNYEKAVKKAYNVKWKTSECSAGPDCWCRIIEPEEPIIYKDREILESLYIAGSGCMPKEFAVYIVRLHNMQIVKKWK